MAWTTVGTLDLVTGIILLGFAIWIGLAGKFSGRFAAFALFEGMFGLSIVAGELATGIWGIVDLNREPPLAIALWAIANVAKFASAAGLWWFVRTTAPDPTPGILGAAIIMATSLLVFLGTGIVGRQDMVLLADAREILWIHWGTYAGLAVHVGAMLAGAWTFGVRAQTADGPLRRDLGIMAVALMLFPIIFLLSYTFALVEALPPVIWWGVWAATAAVAVAIAWLVCFQRTRWRGALIVALLAPAMAIFGILLGSRFPDVIGGGAASRIIALALLSYAISRHHLLGLDAKIRFTISKSTVAAIFITVVFLASEGAQLAFGDDKKWLGLLAGGVLVFALAPLSRFADKIAQKAVPAQAPASTDAGETYRLLLRRFLLDAKVGADEERALARTATALGLTPDQVFELRAQESG